MCTASGGWPSGRTTPPKATFKIQVFGPCLGWESLTVPSHLELGRSAPFCLWPDTPPAIQPLPATFTVGGKDQQCHSFVLKAEEWRKTDFVLERENKLNTLDIASSLFLCLLLSLSQRRPWGEALAAPSWPPSPHTHRQHRPPGSSCQINSEGSQSLLLASPAEHRTAGVTQSPCCSNALMTHCSPAASSAR